jgi:hypothetical protein
MRVLPGRSRCGLARADALEQEIAQLKAAALAFALIILPVVAMLLHRE